MSPREAAAVLATALASTVQRDLDPATSELFQRHLLPLPYERTLTRVREYVAANRWCSTLEELLDACGVPASARPLLVKATQDGESLMPSLRHSSGWELVPSSGPLPRGVAEYLSNAGLPLPEGRAVDLSLPAAPDTPRNGAPTDVRDAIKALSTRFQTSTRAIVAVQERRAPAIPVELQPAYEKLQVAVKAAEAAERSHVEYAAEYRRRLAELIEDASPADLPIEAVKPATVRLLKRLVEYGGDVAAAEVLGDVWGLSVTAFETAPKDRFAGEPPTKVRAVLGESGESRQ